MKAPLSRSPIIFKDCEGRNIVCHLPRKRGSIFGDTFVKDWFSIKILTGNLYTSLNHPKNLMETGYTPAKVGNLPENSANYCPFPQRCLQKNIIYNNIISMPVTAPAAGFCRPGNILTAGKAVLSNSKTMSYKTNRRLLR
jgi:hypothetical protein